MHSPDLQLREDVRRDLTSRSMCVRAATANDTDRSVEAVLGSETPVEVYDWASGGTVEEILVMSGARAPVQLPLLANHDRWSLDATIGSARDLRVDGSQMTGRLVFAGDEYSLRAWQKVRDGHLTDVSVGYRVNASTLIQAGQSAAINGRTYTASPKRALRVTTDWTPKEVSLVPIGADQSAKIREDQIDQTTRNLKETTVEPDTTPNTDVQRTDSAPAAGSTPPPPASPPVNADQVRAEAVLAERARVQQLTQLASSDVPPVVLQRAIAEGWDDARASHEFLTAVRSSRTPPPAGASPPASGPAIHSRSLETDLSVRSLAAGLLARSGLDPTASPIGGGPLHIYDGRRQRRGDALTEQDADRGERFSRMSWVDVCRLCVMLDEHRWEMDPDEAVRTAVSGTSFSYVFGTNVYAKILAGWAEAEDSTAWCANEPDIPNFLQQEDITLSASSQLDRLPPGGTANDATASDKHETYKLARYAKKFTVDEQDLLSDRLSALLQIPIEMGNAARRLRPDIVYSVLLENPTLVADGGALFNATAVTTAGGHANLGTGALSTTNFATALAAMWSQRSGNVCLNIRPRYMIVPAALAFTGATILNGIALAKTHATKSDPDYVPINPVSNTMLEMLQGQPVELVVDDRIGASGVYDPRTKTTRTGSATNWFLSAGGNRTIRVGTRRGTNGLPVMRQYTLDRGQWGIGWDINYDVCVVVADFPGLYKSTGVA